MLTAADFHTNYDKSPGCWNWKGSAMSKGMGYGRASVDGVRDYAHRHAWRLAFGAIPTETPIVRHDCDNVLCVRPDHLKLGTHTDNIQDAVQRNRMSRGENRYNAVLTPSDVLAIRDDCRLLADIAADYGISRAQACRVRSGKRWTHVIGNAQVTDQEDNIAPIISLDSKTGTDD